MCRLPQTREAVMLAPGRPRVPAAFRDQTRTTAALRRYFVTKKPRFLAVLHGDPHHSNKYLDGADGSPGFLYW